MKIGVPVSSIPPSKNRRATKYGEVWDAVMRITDGSWLPVKCDSSREARNLYFAAYTHRTLALEVKQQEDVVYLRPRKKTK